MRDWITDFRETIETSADRLRQINESETGKTTEDGKWSTKEILGHLVDSAANNHTRFVLAQLRDDLVFPGYEQNKWVEIQHYRQASWPLLVELWRAYNLHLLHVMSCAPDDKLKSLCFQHTMHDIAWKKVSEKAPVTLEYLMRDYIAHLKHHIGQILGDDNQ